MFSPESWSYLTTPSSKGYDSLWAPYLILSLLANETTIIWSFANIVLFFQKRHYFPKSYIAFMIFTAVVLTVDYIVGNQIDAVKKEMRADDFRSVARAYVLCAVWIPYFLTSKRVKLTFTH